MKIKRPKNKKTTGQTEAVMRDKARHQAISWSETCFLLKIY